MAGNAAVPEPGTTGLLLTAALGVLGHRRRGVDHPKSGIGTADYADDTDGQALAGEGDHTGSVSKGGENGGYQFLNP